MAEMPCLCQAHPVYPVHRCEPKWRFLYGRTARLGRVGCGCAERAGRHPRGLRIIVRWVDFRCPRIYPGRVGILRRRLGCVHAGGPGRSVAGARVRHGGPSRQHGVLRPAQRPHVAGTFGHHLGPGRNRRQRAYGKPLRRQLRSRLLRRRRPRWNAPRPWRPAVPTARPTCGSLPEPPSRCWRML